MRTFQVLRNRSTADCALNLRWTEQSEPVPSVTAMRLRKQGERRSGVALVMVIVILIVLSGIAAQTVRRVMLERRQFRIEALRQQTIQLVEAGFRLARQSRDQNAAWDGVVWNIPAGQIHQTNSGSVDIRIQNDICTVTARYPDNSEIPVQITRIRKFEP